MEWAHAYVSALHCREGESETFEAETFLLPSHNHRALLSKQCYHSSQQWPETFLYQLKDTLCDVHRSALSDLIHWDTLRSLTHWMSMFRGWGMALHSLQLLKSGLMLKGALLNSTTTTTTTGVHRTHGFKQESCIALTHSSSRLVLLMIASPGWPKYNARLTAGPLDYTLFCLKGATKGVLHNRSKLLGLKPWRM